MLTAMVRCGRRSSGFCYIAFLAIGTNIDIFQHRPGLHIPGGEEILSRGPQEATEIWAATVIHRDEGGNLRANQTKAKGLVQGPKPIQFLDRWFTK